MPTLRAWADHRPDHIFLHGNVILPKSFGYVILLIPDSTHIEFIENQPDYQLLCFFHSFPALTIAEKPKSCFIRKKFAYLYLKMNRIYLRCFVTFLFFLCGRKTTWQFRGTQRRGIQSLVGTIVEPESHENTNTASEERKRSGLFSGIFEKTRGWEKRELVKEDIQYNRIETEENANLAPGLAESSARVYTSCCIYWL